MKAEIKDGYLILDPETKREEHQILYWSKDVYYLDKPLKKILIKTERVC